MLLGLGESQVVVETISWGVALMGANRSGKVMALVGAGMYGAFAVGGPLGLLLLHYAGFAGLMVACVVVPMLGLWMVRGVPEVLSPAGKRESFWRILGRIWRPGATAGLQGVGFAGLGAFISLYFSSRGWPYAGLGLTCFGTGFVIVRFACGHLPDRIGGTPVAIVSLLVEICGQYLLWVASGPSLTLDAPLSTQGPDAPRRIRNGTGRGRRMRAAHCAPLFLKRLTAPLAYQPHLPRAAVPAR